MSYSEKGILNLYFLGKIILVFYICFFQKNKNENGNGCFVKWPFLAFLRIDRRWAKGLWSCSLEQGLNLPDFACRLFASKHKLGTKKRSVFIYHPLRVASGTSKKEQNHQFETFGVAHAILEMKQAKASKFDYQNSLGHLFQLISYSTLYGWSGC